MTCRDGIEALNEIFLVLKRKQSQIKLHLNPSEPKNLASSKRFMIFFRSQ